MYNFLHNATHYIEIYYALILLYALGEYTTEFASLINSRTK